MTDVYIGELTEYTMQHWKDMGDPFEVLEKDNKAGIGLNWIEFMAWANSHLKNKVQIDWGSFAWRCDKDDMMRFCEDHRMVTSDFILNMAPGKSYGAVLIEMY